VICFVWGFKDVFLYAIKLSQDKKIFIVCLFLSTFEKVEPNFHLFFIHL